MPTQQKTSGGPLRCLLPGNGARELYHDEADTYWFRILPSEDSSSPFPQGIAFVAHEIECPVLDLEARIVSGFETEKDEELWFELDDEGEEFWEVTAHRSHDAWWPHG